MVDILPRTPATPLNIIVRPNSAVNGRWRTLVFTLLIPIFGLVGIGFTLLGAWPVVPGLVLTLLALDWGLRHIERHAGDFEQITLRDDRLIVNRHEPDRDEHFEFNSHWVQVVSHAATPGVNAYLALRSHGRELPVGLGLSDDERAVVSAELTRQLSGLRH